MFWVCPDNTLPGTVKPNTFSDHSSSCHERQYQSTLSKQEHAAADNTNTSLQNGHPSCRHRLTPMEAVEISLHPLHHPAVRCTSYRENPNDWPCEPPSPANFDPSIVPGHSIYLLTFQSWVWGTKYPTHPSKWWAVTMKIVTRHY